MILLYETVIRQGQRKKVQEVRRAERGSRQCFMEEASPQQCKAGDERRACWLRGQENASAGRKEVGRKVPRQKPHLLLSRLQRG